MNFNIAKSQKKTTVLLVMFYSLLLSPLFFYIWVFERPELPMILIVSLYCVWIISMIMDMRITLSIKSLIKSHESNIIFRNLYQKHKPRIAILIQLLIEISFVLFVSSLVFPREFGTRLFFDYHTSAILAGIVGVIHLLAWNSNRQTITMITNKEKFNKTNTIV